MGMHVESGCADRSPAIFFNHCGYLPWGGKQLSEFTACDALEMREFIESEAYREGHKSANEPGHQQWNPFDDKFMFGEPHRLWKKCIAIGLEHGIAAPNEERLAPPKFWTGTEIALIESLIDQCEALATGFEEDRRRLGLTPSSTFRPLAVTLLGWCGYTTSAGTDPKADYALAFSDHDAWLARFDKRGRFRDRVTGHWASLNGEFFCEERNSWMTAYDDED